MWKNKHKMDGHPPHTHTNKTSDCVCAQHRAFPIATQLIGHSREMRFNICFTSSSPVFISFDFSIIPLFIFVLLSVIQKIRKEQRAVHEFQVYKHIQLNITQTHSDTSELKKLSPFSSVVLLFLRCKKHTHTVVQHWVTCHHEFAMIPFCIHNDKKEHSFSK